MRVGILGAAEAHLDGVAVDLGIRKQRALLSALALHRGQPVTPDAIVDLLWGDAPPATVTATLQGYVARLRRALEPHRPPRAPSEVLVTRDNAYALVLPAGALDADRFEDGIGRVRDRLGPVSLTGPSADGAEELFTQVNEALALWRGTPFTELEDARGVLAERARLEELRATALEDRAVLGLALGRHAVVAAELEVLTSTYPLRERLWALRALALTRAGRQADALEVLRQVRELLTEELGLEPGQELRDLQTAVLRQDPALEWSGSPSVPVAVTMVGPAGGRAPGSPLVGRDDELAALAGLLDRSADGPVFAAAIGEPGIGKSRLCAELAGVARAEGVHVVVGRCSQDEGAPPLYPWAGVLRSLGHDPPRDATEDSAARFRVWEAIVDLVLEEAERRHLLVVLDDLHWADSSTLRVLRLLAERAESGRLLVIATWRHEPPPAGQLAVVAEMFARRHALQLRLSGLSEDEVREVVASVAEATPSVGEAAALRERTDGNPFFLVEYARLARERGDLAALLSEPDPPGAVQDVLVRRIAGLPDSSATTLRQASVLGREFDVPTLARLLDTPVPAVLDALDPPLAAGLVREADVDRFRFAHALVRDTVYAGLTQSRRARMHARAAEVLTAAGGREGEVARHWLAAGPSYADRAWRAARDAARVAQDLYAYDEAVDLLTGALRAFDAAGGEEGERYHLLLALTRANQLVDDRIELRRSAHAALAAAGGDVERELAVVRMLSTMALWQPGTFGQIDEVVVGTVRRCLERLPPGDGAARCRAMIALALELYYRPSSTREREALTEQSLAMARRLGDDRLLLEVLLLVPLALWSPASATWRIEVTTEAAELAGELGDAEALCVALALRCSATSESGQVTGLLELVAEAREVAQRERRLFTQLFLDGVEIPWRAMRGQFEVVRELTDRMIVVHERINVVGSADGVVGALLVQQLWSEDPQGLVPFLAGIEGIEVMPKEGALALVLARTGRLDEARSWLDREGIELSPGWWFSTLHLASLAEAAMRTRSTSIAAAVYERMAPLAGRPAAGGSGIIIGVIDMFLAMAAHATGERDLATRHADAAVRLCSQWEIPLAEAWFARVREEFGF